MNDFFYRLEFIRAYIDGFFILTKGDWTDHGHKLELTLNKLKGKRLKCNIEKYFFGQTKMEYLALWVARDSIKSTNRNTEVITKIRRLTS